MFSSNVARAWKWLWAHLMVLLGNECQVEACFGPFRDSVSLGARLMHDLCQTYYRLRNHLTHLVVLIGDVGQVKAVWVCLEIVLISAQDRCTVCAKMYHRHGNHFGRTQWYT
jgi:hypothetical protein